MGRLHPQGLNSPCEMGAALAVGPSKVLILMVQAQGLSAFPNPSLLHQCISHPMPRDTWKKDFCALPGSPHAYPIWYNSTPTFRLQDASAAHPDPLPHNPLSPALHTHPVTQSPPPRLPITSCVFLSPSGCPCLAQFWR